MDPNYNQIQPTKTAIIPNKPKFKNNYFIKPLEFNKMSKWQSNDLPVAPASTTHQKFQNQNSKQLIMGSSQFQQSDANINISNLNSKTTYSPFPKINDKPHSNHHFSQSPPHDLMMETKRQSYSFLMSKNENSQVVFDSNQFLEDKYVSKYKNYLLVQKNEKQKKTQIKDLKIKNSEKQLEALELSLQSENDPKVKISKLMQFLQDKIRNLLGAKPLALMLMRVSESLGQSIEQSSNQYLHELQVNILEKNKMTKLLRKRLQEIQKYKDIEQAQEERLKNMFEHLRQLDLEIEQFQDNNEILDAKMEFQQPIQFLDEQQKQRIHNHHNMKLLEFDLQTIHQQVSKDLLKVLENEEEAEVLGMDPKYLADQVKSGISDAMAGLQERIHTMLYQQQQKIKNSRVERQTQTEEWDFTKITETIENLTRENIIIEKERRWLKTKIDRSVAKDVEKDERIVNLLAKVEKSKETEMEYKSKIHEKDNIIRDLKLDLSNKQKEIQDLDQKRKELEEKLNQQDQELKKIENGYKQKLSQQQQQNFNIRAQMARGSNNSKPSSSRRLQGSTAQGNNQYEDSDTTSHQHHTYTRKKQSLSLYRGPGSQEESLSSQGEGEHQNNQKGHLNTAKGGKQNSFNQKRGSHNSTNKTSFLAKHAKGGMRFESAQGDKVHGSMNNKVGNHQFTTPQIKPRGLPNKRNLKQIHIGPMNPNDGGHNERIAPLNLNSQDNSSSHHDGFNYQDPNTPTVIRSESIFKNEMIKQQQEAAIFSPQAKNSNPLMNFIEVEKLNAKIHQSQGPGSQGGHTSNQTPEITHEILDDHQFAQQSYEFNMAENNIDPDQQQPSNLSQFYRINNDQSSQDRITVHMKVKNSILNENAITEESNEQNEDKQVQTDQIFFPTFNKAVQTNNDYSTSFINDQVITKSIELSRKKIKNFAKLKLNYSAINSYNNSPRIEFIKSYYLEDNNNKRHHNSSGYSNHSSQRSHQGDQPSSQREILQNNMMQNKSFFGKNQDNQRKIQSQVQSPIQKQKAKIDKSLLYMLGYQDRVKLSKMNRPTHHIRASNFKPDTDFKEMVTGSASPFKIHY